MIEAEVGPGRCTSRKVGGVAVGGGWISMKCTTETKGRGLTVRICSSLPENLIKGVAALAIKEIGVHA